MQKVARVISGSKYARPGAVALIFAIAGVVAIAITQAATPTASLESEAGLKVGVATVSDTSASGGQATKFGTATTATCPVTASNMPGSADPWGGCWPGEFNTGYPHGLPGDTRTPVTLANYTGSCTVGAGTTVTITAKNVDCSSGGLFVYGNLTIKNSKVIGYIYGNGSNAVITIEDSELDGGNQVTYPVVGSPSNITARRVNAYNGQHSIICYGNCIVEDSWLHDQFEAGEGPHQNAFISPAGNHYRISHNTAHCTTTGCTADITFTRDGNTYDAVIDKNLLMPTPGSYCTYPGGGSKPYLMYQFTVTNNVFKRGSNNKCGGYGAVAGWDTPQTTTPGANGYMNYWSNNKWEDGAVVNP